MLEEPKNVNFKLFNMSVGNMNLKLDSREATDSDVKILSIENGSESLGYIKPGEMFYLIVGDAATQMDRLSDLGFGEPIQLDANGDPL